MSALILKDDGYPKFKKIIHKRKWIGRVCSMPDGTFLGIIGRIEVRLGIVKLSIELGEATVSPDALYYTEFCRQMADLTELKPEWLNRDFRIGGENYRLVGMKARGKNRMMILRLRDNSLRVTTEEQVALFFGRAGIHPADNVGSTTDQSRDARPLGELLGPLPDRDPVRRALRRRPRDALPGQGPGRGRSDAPGVHPEGRAMPELTPGQRMMVEDGLPAEAILDPADRKAAWVGRKLTKVRDLKTPPKDEDPATKALRREIAITQDRRQKTMAKSLTELTAEIGAENRAAEAKVPSYTPEQALKAAKDAPGVHPEGRAMPELTPGQRMMVEDGLPAEAILDPADRKAAWVGRKLTKVRDLKTPPKDEDPATKALRKEIAAADAKKKAERLARLKELTPKPAKQETDMATKKTTAKKTSPKAAKKPAGKPAGKKAPKAPAAPKATPAASAGRPDKVQIIANLMARPEGASMEEMVAAIQIEPHPMRAKIKLVRDRLGYTTTRPSKENGYRYFAQPPQSVG